MIPYFEQPSLDLGPVTLKAFGVIVALAAMAGLELARRRFRRLGLDTGVADGMTGYALMGGILGAHLFSVLLYFPEKLARDPWLLLRFWEDISSFGSMLGGLLGIALYLWRKAPGLSPQERWSYLDVAAFAFPVSLAIGRFACTLAHDHPGTVTRFPLAVSLETAAARAYVLGVYESAGRTAELPPPDILAGMGFHDLGWYEFLFLCLVYLPALLLLDRRRRPVGFLLALFGALYMPVRFGLDFLRVSDARYLGLTPAQFIAAGAAVVSIIWLKRLSASPPAAPVPRVAGGFDP